VAAIVEESNAERVRRAHDCFRRADGASRWTWHRTIEEALAAAEEAE
jgi:hypothetical protein